MQRPITLRDVARRPDAHPSTVWRALNERTRDLVNTATVTRVLAAAEELGYRPNALAQGLRANRTGIVGMLVPDLTNPLFPPIVRGIEDRLTHAGATLLVANTDNDVDKERAIVDVMLRRRVDGLILATARREHPILDDLLRQRCPVVLVNRTADTPALPSVSGDDHAGIGQAVRHLIELGHRRIAHLAGSRSVSTGLVRHQSLVTWMEIYGLPVDPELIVFCDWFNQRAGADGFRELLDRGADFTAIVAANDLVALGCYDVAAERGIRIPEDVSIVGYNDIVFSDRFAPPLTSVRIPHYEIGVRAAELVLEAIEDPAGVRMSLRLPPELRVRGSTGPPRTVVAASAPDRAVGQLPG